MGETRKRILWVTAASATDTVLSFLTPFVLARLVSIEQFGEYRFFWLVVLSLVSIAVIGIEHALVYFLYRVRESRRMHVVGNTLMYFHLAAVFAALLAGPWNAFLGERLETDNHLLLAIFCLLYLSSLPLDHLPLAHNHPGIHARNAVITAVARVACVLGPTLITRDISGAFYGLLGFAVLRLVLLAAYNRGQYGRVVFPIDRQLFRDQVRYSVPFGIAGAFYIFRTQGEQWLVSGLFSIEDFAIFSIAFVVTPLLQVLQYPVARVLQPRIHAYAAEGDLARAHELNRRANSNVGFVVYPLIIFGIIFADPVVAFLLPENYGPAAMVMQVYLLGQFRLALESTSLLQVVGDGAYAMRLSGALLVVALLISSTGAVYWGLVAAAVGSVATSLAEAFVIQRRLAGRLGVPFSDMQKWSIHARLLIMALAANALAFAVGAWLPVELSPFFLLAVTGTTMAVAYALLPAVMGVRDVAGEVLSGTPWRTQTS